MKTSMSSTESKTDSTEIQDTTQKPTDDKFDDLGYEKDPSIVEPPKEETPPAEDDKPVDKPSTGYGDLEEEEPAKKEDEKPAEDDKPVELTDEQKAQKEVAEVVKDLGDNYDKDKILKFANDNKFSKEQLQAYVKLVKEEEAEIKKLQEENKKLQRKSWHEELKKDPEFGGEHFVKNLDRVEKVLQNNLPNTKKVLTEKGGMLPPYIMKDLLGLAKALNPTNKFVGGEPPAPKDDGGNFLDEMYK